MATYRVELRDLFTFGHAVRASSVQFSTFVYRDVLNGPGSFEGEIAFANLPSNLTPGNRELLVYRTDGGVETQVWGGYLDVVDVDVDNKVLRVGGQGYWSRFRRRLVRGSAVFKSGDGDTNGAVPTIAWRLLSTASGTQGLTNGDLGLRQGTHSGTIKTVNKRVYCGADLRFVGDIIEGFAAHGNLDFECTPARTASQVALFNTWKRRGTDRSGSITLSGSNTISLTYSISAADITTAAVVYSSAQCDAAWEPATVNRNVATYGVNDVGIVIEGRDQADATDAANENLRIMSAPLWTAQAVYYEGTGPALTAYSLGDTLALTPGDGYTTGSKNLAVMERAVDVGPEGALVSLTLEERQA